MTQSFGRQTVQALAWLTLLACNRPSEPGSPAAGPAEPPMPALAATVDPAADAAELGQETAVVLSAALVRRQPTEARLVPLAGKRGRQSNVLTTLYRGEAVWVRARQDHFVDVTLSDESHGWVKEDGILLGPNLQLATVLHPTRLFNRPDLLALQGSRTVAPGTLLIVLRHKDQFSLVNHAGGQSAWVLTALLQTDAAEVGAAKLVHRARLLQERDGAGAEAVIELLRGQFGRTQLFASLEAAQSAAVAPAATEQLGAAAGDAGEGVPAPQPDTPAQVTPSLRLTPAPAAAVPTAAGATGGAPGLQNWQPPAVPAEPPAPGGAAAADGLDDGPDHGSDAPEDDSVF